MAILEDLAETARRYERWRRIQDESKSKDESRGPASVMLAKRQRFTNAKANLPDPSVFFESVIEGNDLQPVRYFRLGELATTPIGRVHIDLGKRVGQGYATGFLVAPGLLLTNQHVLQTADVARAATVTFDAEDDVAACRRCRGSSSSTWTASTSPTPPSTTASRP